MATSKKTAPKRTSSTADPSRPKISLEEPGAASEIGAREGSTDPRMTDAPLGDVAGEPSGDREQSAEEAFGAQEILPPAELDPIAGDRLLALLEIAERQALRRARVPSPEPLWHPDERMLLELLAPSAAQAFAGAEPPSPKLALALLLGAVLLHAGALASAHNRATAKERGSRDARDWGRAKDAAGEAARAPAGGAPGFPPPFKPNGRA